MYNSIKITNIVKQMNVFFHWYITGINTFLSRLFIQSVVSECIDQFILRSAALITKNNNNKTNKTTKTVQCYNENIWYEEFTKPISLSSKLQSNSYADTILVWLLHVLSH